MRLSPDARAVGRPARDAARRFRMNSQAIQPLAAAPTALQRRFLFSPGNGSKNGWVRA